MMLPFTTERRGAAVIMTKRRNGDDGDAFELRQREEMVELVVYRGEVMKLRSFDGDGG